MRSQIIVYIFTIFTILLISILCVITQQSSFDTRLQRDLNSAMEISMSTLSKDGKLVLDSNYTSTLGVSSNDLYNTSLNITNSAALGNFKKDFVSVLTNNINNKIKRLEVNIFGVDEDSGLLSCEVIAYYNYLNGKEGSVSCYRTILLNKEVKY